MNSKQHRLSRIAACAFVLGGLSASSAWAQNCPDYALNGTRITISASDLYAPQSVKVQAGGEVSLDGCGSVPGSGRVSKRPDFTIQYNGGGKMRLEFRVNSECDAVLLVNRPNGEWLFDDDSNGNADPKISISAAPSGLYDVWVGRLGSTSLCNATLIMETF
jgi:hypothetical protein